MLSYPIVDFLRYVIFQFRKRGVISGEITVSAHVAGRDILQPQLLDRSSKYKLQVTDNSFFLHHKFIDIGRAVELDPVPARAVMSPVIKSAGTVAAAVQKDNFELVL